MSLALVWALTGSSAYSPVPEKQKATISAEIIAPMFDGRAVRARAPTPTGAMWAPQARKAAQESSTSGGDSRSGPRWDGKRGLNPSKDARNDASAAGERLFEETLPNGCSYLEPNCKGTDPKSKKVQPVVASGSECPNCGHNTNGVPNCCSTGGAWENMCTNSHDEPGMHSEFSEHTWDEGFKACSHIASKAHAPGDVSPLQAAVLKHASQQGSQQAAGVSGSTKEAEALKSVNKPFIEPIPLVDGEQARKCDSEREEWCDGCATITGVQGCYDDKTEIVHDGQVMLIDFWATWCPPCQAPMAHNQKMLEDHPDWAGKVRIIGLSLDQDVATIKTRVDDKKWNKVEHYWKSTSQAPNEWGIQGIPHCALVDKTGKIVWRGHPGSVKVDEQIAALL